MCVCVCVCVYGRAENEGVYQIYFDHIPSTTKSSLFCVRDIDLRVLSKVCIYGRQIYKHTDVCY